MSYVQRQWHHERPGSGSRGTSGCGSGSCKRGSRVGGALHAMWRGAGGAERWPAATAMQQQWQSDGTAGALCPKAPTACRGERFRWNFLNRERCVLMHISPFVCHDGRVTCPQLGRIWERSQVYSTFGNTVGGSEKSFLSISLKPSQYSRRNFIYIIEVFFLLRHPNNHNHQAE